MTGEDIYLNALALLGDDSSARGDNSTEVIIRLINTAFGLVQPYNNQLREYRKKKPLAEIPRIESLSDEIPLEPEYQRNVLPYRLASDLYFADDELGKAEYYNQMFYSTIEMVTTPILGVIHDVYGGDDEI